MFFIKQIASKHKVLWSQLGKLSPNFLESSIRLFADLRIYFPQGPMFACTCQGSTLKSSLHDPTNGNGLLHTNRDLRRSLAPGSDNIGAICMHYRRLSHRVLCENIVKRYGMDA